MIHHLDPQLQIFKHSVVHLFYSPDHCLSWLIQDLTLSWNMPSVHKRERAHPPHHPHLWCSPHFGWLSSTLVPRTLWISVWPTTNMSCLHKRAQALLTAVWNQKAAHSYLCWSSPPQAIHLLLSFLWLFPRDWSCRVLHHYCTAHQSHSQTCFLTFFPACWLANKAILYQCWIV